LIREGRPLKILLVDDEAIIVEWIKYDLEDFGHSVTAFTDPRDARRKFEENPYDFEVVITDLTMPHLSGQDLARIMLTLRSDLPIILCTGHGETLTGDSYGSSQFIHVLAKPLISDCINRTLQQIMKNKPKSV
jgi:DNA-binding NtrC family response regulator